MAVQLRATGERYNTATRKLSDDIVRAILTSSAGCAALGKQYNVSRETVRRIRYGYTYLNVLPDLPRWEEPKPRERSVVYNRTCWKCIHSAFYFERKNDKWKSTARKPACALGLPDPLEEGARFARWCAAYAEAPAGHEPICIGRDVAAWPPGSPTVFPHRPTLTRKAGQEQQHQEAAA